jgi:hypothetical protein
MNVEIGTMATQFLFCEYLLQIFGTMTLQCYSHAEFQFYRDFFFSPYADVKFTMNKSMIDTCWVASGQDGRAIDAGQLLQFQPQQTQVELFRILTLKGLFHEISLRSAPATANTGGTLPDPDVKGTVS